MFKKIILIVLFVGLTGALVAGAINRTQAKSDQLETNPGGRGQSAEHTAQLSGEANQGSEANGRGNQGQGQAQSEERALGRYQEETGVVQPGVGQAEVEAWITLSGRVDSVTESELLVELVDGTLVSVANRPWSFALEQGFQAAAGDEIRLTGFYENEAFEVGQLENLSTELVVPIRQETGRPLWAGGGRWG